jgi:predicted hydrocarbon binding protein
MKQNLGALSNTLALLDLAGEESIGKAAPALMYHTGKDLGKREGKSLDCTDDLEEALAAVFGPPGEAWKIELWKNVEEDDYWFGEGLEMKIRLLFQRCAVRQACLNSGVRLGGMVCQLTHGYTAGCLERIFERRVDIRTEHMGPGACMLVLETVME